MTHPTPSSVEFLRQILIERQRRNPLYSLRALARDLGVSPAFVSQLLSRKKSLSLERALQLAQNLSLNSSQKRNLIQAVLSEKTGAALSIDEVPDNTDALFPLEVDQFKLMSEWYHVAILDLATTRDFRSDVSWIARRLGISTPEVRNALERLERLGLLQRKNGAWSKTRRLMSIPTDRSHAALRAYHSAMISKALKQLEDGSDQAFSRRSIAGTTVAIDASRVEEARELIRQFRVKFMRLMTEGPADEVYQLNVQFFPLTKRKQGVGK